MDLVIVYWADAHCGDPGWVEMANYADTGEEIVTTAGFHAKEGTPGYKPGHFTVWQTVTGGEGIHPFHIPEGMVRRVSIMGCVPDVLD